jgi:uncharacterized protein (TIGR02328 family)
MRLWHISLIPVLPRPQLVAAWRELSSIAGAIQKNGTPNHILVNFVLNYDYDDFINYAKYVREEMTRRGYRTMNSVWDKIIALKPNYDLIPLEEVYKEKMDTTYLIICYWNLMEKHLCGGISDTDIHNIQECLTQNMTNKIDKVITYG